ncbi:MAG: trimethylamine methyltransferase family protein [Granulosicoccus sp.]|nr:trimethylamine methyltransferase family protein [Granulosicoccus sp.]
MKTRRSGGRNARRFERQSLTKAFDTAWRQWVNPYPPIEQFSQDELESIHLASLDVLQNVGIRVLSEEGRQIFSQAHFRVREEVVYFDAEQLLELIALAPEEVSLSSRNTDRKVVMGGNKVSVCTTGGAPNFSDLDHGRRPGSISLLENLCRLAQSFDVIHMIGPLVEPQDLPANVRHLDMTRAVVNLTDKPPFVYFRGREAVADAYEIIRIGTGLTREEFERTPVCYAVANSNSPLQLDNLMCLGIIDAARAGQLMVLTPFTLAGAMAPVTVVGALVQQNAEALAGIALSQIVRPGAPVCYGSFTSNVDMRTGSPAFGTPESARAAFASGQLARRYGLPLRSSAVTAANYPDAQAAYETQMSLWSALMGGTNLLLHGAGWLEGGLTASAEKFVIDVEMLQMFAELFKPLEVNESTLATQTISDVGHGGHFFGAAHTIERFETAFYSPLLSDWSNFENWQDNGALDATLRANQIYKDTLESYQEPQIDLARLEEIDAFITRRKKEGGANIER